MELDRRSLLKAGTVAGALAAGPAALAAAAPRRIVIFDSSLAESRAFHRTIAGAGAIDLSREPDTLFAALRGDLPAGSTVEGLTGWSDWITVRRELERRGLRVSDEARISAPVSRRADLFRWSMRTR